VLLLALPQVLHTGGGRGGSSGKYVVRVHRRRRGAAEPLASYFALAGEQLDKFLSYMPKEKVSEARQQVCVSRQGSLGLGEWARFVAEIRWILSHFVSGQALPILAL
jgi:hypothetical protein